VLMKTNVRLRNRYEELIRASRSSATFPRLTAVDQNDTLQAPRRMHESIPDLKAFLQDIQQRIALYRDDQGVHVPLYYSLPDLRSFLAGMAMTRLILLQGLSGTGKTRLPLAFAQALGNAATIVEVQAGWRDPQDLIGHYNAFEEVFHETDFLVALYRAHTPALRDAVHIVVLDEMNLSHPEQYFSDVISALESGKNRLRLLDHALTDAPRYLDGEHKLPIAGNVWFVGTANQDETTKDFADKTYDRSQVIELPHRPQRFPLRPPAERPPVSVRALLQAFEQAQRTHRQEADAVLHYLDTELSELLRDRFGIAWGPRLERQIRAYVPVVVAAGGSRGEAADHILAMRILRKLKDRYGTRPDHLETLRRRIDASWADLDAGTPPERSLKLIDHELRRLGSSTETAA